MAITLTSNRLPQGIYTGKADKELAQPLVNFMEGIQKAKITAESAKKAIKGAWIRLQSWWEYGEKNPLALLAGWIDNTMRISDMAIGGVNLADWAKKDPIGAGSALSLVLSSGLIVKVGPAIIGATLSTAHKVLTAAGSLGKVASFLPGVGGLVRWFVGGVQRIWNFNWNQTDKDIRNQQKARIEGLAGRWGEALGSTLGTLCGFTLGRAAKNNAPRLVAFNPGMLARLKELEFRSFADPGELWEEAVEELKSALTATGSAVLSVIFLEAYVNIRKIIKAGVKYSGLGTVFPWLGKAIAQWGAPGSRPWSFASTQENFVEGIKNPVLQNFTEEFLEAAQEMCGESSIIVSYTLD
jgi:hypothetical protein